MSLAFDFSELFTAWQWLADLVSWALLIFWVLALLAFDFSGLWRCWALILLGFDFSGL